MPFLGEMLVPKTFWGARGRPKGTLGPPKAARRVTGGPPGDPWGALGGALGVPWHPLALTDPPGGPPGGWQGALGHP